MTRHGMVVVLLACAALLPGCGGHEGGEEATPPPVVPVRIQPLVARSVVPLVTCPGQWRLSDSLTIAAPFRSYVETLRPRAGDRVTRGAPIGVLVTYESRAALHGAEILVRQARSAAEREEASRALRLAKRDLVRVPLSATATGTVLRRSAEPGSEVAESGELLTIVPEGSVVFEAHVPRADAGRVTIGARAQVALEGGGAVLTRVQRRLPQTSEADQTALVWLAPVVREPFGVLGRLGTASIETGAAHQAVVVPDSALVEDDLTGEIRVARVGSDSIAVWTKVRLGAAQERAHELLAPALRPGTAVVVRGQRGLPDSTRVRVER